MPAEYKLNQNNDDGIYVCVNCLQKQSDYDHSRCILLQLPLVVNTAPFGSCTSMCRST